MSERIEVDDLTLHVHRSQRRATIGITVERDGSLTAHVPIGVSQKTVENVVRSKAMWIYTKLAEKPHSSPSRVATHFVEGERFYYLGRRYALLLVDSETTTPLRLHRGQFQLRRNAQPDARRHFIAWYTQRGRVWIPQRIRSLVGIDTPKIRVRDLGFRWGSCSPNGWLNFHWRVMLLPTRIIEYVIAHEWVHIDEPRHDAAYWNRLGKVMPDYVERKQWLAEKGSALCQF